MFNAIFRLLSTFPVIDAFLRLCFSPPLCDSDDGTLWIELERGVGLRLRCVIVGSFLVKEGFREGVNCSDVLGLASTYYSVSMALDLPLL